MSPTTKTCKVCEATKPLTDFYERAQGALGRSAKCKECDRAYRRQYRIDNRAHLNELDQKRRDADPDRYHGYHLYYRFGLTVDQYAELRDRQGGACAICGVQESDRDARAGGHKWLCVDHDHETGLVRGLLCFQCNTGVGNLKENPTLLEIAAEYLRAR